MPLNNELFRQPRVRNITNKLFQWTCWTSVVAFFVIIGLITARFFSSGIYAFYKTEIKLEIAIPKDWAHGKQIYYKRQITESLRKMIDDYEAINDLTHKELMNLFTGEYSVFELKRFWDKSPNKRGTTQVIYLTLNGNLDLLYRQAVRKNELDIEADKYEPLLAFLAEKGLLRTRFNSQFFTNGDSRQSEFAGIGAGLAGTAMTLVVCLVLSLVVAILVGVYLEEFAPKNSKLVSFLELNINNLAAVPAIIFGLIGFLMIDLFKLPRGTALMGGIVLFTMILPSVIQTTRLALRAIPNNIRQASLALGATNMETVFYHVIPPALPGIINGLILSLAKVLGETAPLMLIGMIAFTGDVNLSFTSQAITLPAQIFLWSNQPELLFKIKTSGAILVLVFLLFLFNCISFFIRIKFQRQF